LLLAIPGDQGKNMTDMPGPKFIEGPKDGWFGKNSQKIVLSLIVVLLAIGAYYLYKNYQARTDLLRPAIEGNEQLSPSPSPSPEQSAPVTAADQTGTSQTPVKADTPEIKVQDSKIVAIATKGDGATHLARQALKEYLKDKSDLAGKLKAEQKIYIEDYLQKHTTHPNVLKVGNQIAFSQDLIAAAVSQSQKLSDKQITNLHQYVLLAPSL